MRNDCGWLLCVVVVESSKFQAVNAQNRGLLD
jgi:hypothetical protein